MVGKLCLALAVLAQINCYEYNQQVAISSAGGAYSQNCPVALTGSVSSDDGSFGGSSSSSPITRNVIAKGKYPVALENVGNAPETQIPVITSQMSTPVQERPTVRLPFNIPPPKTVSHSCTCYKTIVRPRVHQHIITVPSIQRYIETSHRPVVENIHYEALPVNAQGSDVGSQYQTLEVPTYNPYQTSQYQPVSLSQLQAIQVPQIQTFDIPQSQRVEMPFVQALDIPQIRTFQVPQFQSIGSDEYDY